jgi:hypothetical protein
LPSTRSICKVIILDIHCYLIMRRLLKKWLLIVTSLAPMVLSAQNISLTKLLSLQKSSLISIQDYVETGTWKLKGIISLKEADSSIFQSRTKRFMDSLFRNHKTEGSPRGGLSQAQLLENTKFDAPAWLEYGSQIDTKLNSTTLFTNSLTVTLPKFYLFNAINLNLNSYDKHNFHHALRFSFGDQETFKSIINEIGILHIPDKDCYVMYNRPLITRVYKLVDQVINLTIINNSIPCYSLEVYSRADYDFLHGAEQDLKGKVDFIH